MKDAAKNIDLQKAILERWRSAEDFYRERDDRTLRGTPELTAYATRPIEILVDPSVADSKSVQQIALVACNLTARWARDVKIVLPFNTPIACGLDRGRFTLLGERIISEMRGADPFGRFEIVSAPDRSMPNGEAIRLFIGEWSRSLNDKIRPRNEDFFVSAAGVIAIGQRGAPIPELVASSEFAPAVALAASLGAADLFKRAIGHREIQWIPTFNWNLLEHAIVPDVLPSRSEVIADRIEIGKVLVAGVGAIGSSLLYLFDLAGVEGHAAVLDRDRVETSNLNRSLLFDVSHVLARTMKTELAENYLRSTRISTARFDGTWRERVAEIGSANFDVWVSFTNEDGAWAQLPFQMPPVVIQGTTTSGWGFGAGRHIPRKEDCTLCRMPRPEAEFRGMCSEGEIEQREAERPVRASLPFLSAASAALVLAELFKLHLPAVGSMPNEIAADLKTGLPAVVALRRQADPDCRGCRMSRSDLWLERGGRGKYRKLSD